MLPPNQHPDSRVVGSFVTVQPSYYNQWHQRDTKPVATTHVHTGVFLSSCTPVSLHMLKCSWAHALSCLFVFCSFASIGHADIMWSIVSSNYWQSLHLLSVSVLNIFVAQYFICNAWSLCFQFLLLSLTSIARGTCLLH